MKKKNRQKRSCEATRQTYRTQCPAADQDLRSQTPCPETENPAPAAPRPPKSILKTSGRLSSAMCRLCHGKFSSRSLRHAFNSWPQDSVDFVKSPVLFHADFQQLVGVQLDQDPRLSNFICKTCHTKFYKCHNILLRFLQRVNLPPMGQQNSKHQKIRKSGEPPVHPGATAWPFTSDRQCLHRLVSWTHHHAETCRSCPDLKEVVEGQYQGSVRAVWGCVDGHSYVMDTCCAHPEPWLLERDTADVSASVESTSSVALPQISTLNDCSSNSEDLSEHEEALSPAPAHSEDKVDDGDLSDRVMENEGSGHSKLSDDELLNSNQRVSRKKKQRQKLPEEPKVKNKPGPKPGWKNKFKLKGEELPSMFKCPYLGCTAVYRGPDGVKKHIREHHEEVKERPCPHPGCNKVFMIDRYLQRHIKLIHTEERNYICDECGQTFKQRKHLSVHQMRHSGAKPLQCEVCGFQCRQRASLKYHMTKHKAEADLEFACIVCEKRFEKAHNLNVHISMVHPLTQAEAFKGGGQQQPPTLICTPSR